MQPATDPPGRLRRAMALGRRPLESPRDGCNVLYPAEAGGVGPPTVPLGVRLDEWTWVARPRRLDPHATLEKRTIA